MIRFLFTSALTLLLSISTLGVCAPRAETYLSRPEKGCWSNKDFKGSFICNIHGLFGPQNAFLDGSTRSLARTGILTADGAGNYEITGRANVSSTLGSNTIDSAVEIGKYFVRPDGRVDLLFDYYYGEYTGTNVKATLILFNGGKKACFSCFSDTSRDPSDPLYSAQIIGSLVQQTN